MSSRNPDYQFISTDTNTLIARLVSAYETITNTVVHPASPEKLFIQWIADVLIQERVIANYAANQNLPSRAEGANLDTLGELFFDKVRPPAQPAVCTVRFYISTAQGTSILIPAGTRVTDSAATLVWETVADAYIPIGDLYTDVMVRCQTAGTVGNGYEIGQIDTIIDVFSYYDHCENITASDGGADEATDQEFYELLRFSQDAYYTAGARGSYIYFAEKVSTEIADVVVNSPGPGLVNIYVLMDDGTIASPEIKSAVRAACNGEYVRPLTDLVSVEDPAIEQYDIEFTYYIPRSTTTGSEEIEAAVRAAVDEYKAWQSSKMGRDINPSVLIGLLMKTGIKRVELTKPEYTPLSDGSDNTVPEVAQAAAVTIINGGFEDD